MTVPEMGWAGKKNGVLLRLAVQSNFDIFITADQNLTYQQNLKQSDITIIVLATKDNSFDTYKRCIPIILKKMEHPTKDIIYISV